MMNCRLVLALSCVAVVLNAQQPNLPPPPGRLIDVGGHRLHIICSGEGSPTVLFEAGASSFAIDWTLVQRDLARTTRVCSYDRAGIGWSDTAALSSPGTDARDLHELLAAAAERPPYVMVGASRGGLLVRGYLLDHAADVTGLVFVDPATEDRLWVMVGSQAVLFASLTPEQLQSMLPRRTVRVPRRNPQRGAPFDRLPPDLYQLRIKLDERLIASTSDTITPDGVAIAQERERLFLARLLASRSAPHPFGDRPTVVLSRGDERNAGREAVHSALARLSTNSRHTVVVGAGHEIHLFEPLAVVQAVADVIQSIRDKTALPQR
jgi:pimeloyl-ACP methyl ester carboxylesterase